MSNNHIVCRLCLNSLSEIEEQNISLFSDYHQNMEYKEVAMSIANLMITFDDNLPDKICDDCGTQLIIFFKFKQKCEISERTLRRLILKEKFPVPVPDVQKKTTMENLLRKYTNLNTLMGEKFETKNNDGRKKSCSPKYVKVVPLKLGNVIIKEEKVCLKQEALDKKSEKEIELKVSVKSSDNIEEPEMEAEYLLDEFQSPIQTFVKEEIADYDDIEMEDDEEDDDELIVSPILNPQSGITKSEQIKTKLKPLSKSCICELCGKAYAHPSSLTQHYQQHTGVKNFSCDLCETKFTRKSHLAVHMRIHNNEKPFICEICSMTFRKSGNLNRHKIVHSDKREFACNLCDKAFKRSSGLHIHMRSHTGDRPYQCEWCSKTYSCYSGFRKHKLKHESSFNNIQGGGQIKLQILSKSDDLDSSDHHEEPYLSRELDEMVTVE